MANILSNQSLVEYIDTLTNVYLLIRGIDPAGPYGSLNPHGYGLGVAGGGWGAAAASPGLSQAIIDAALVGVNGIDPIVALAPALDFVSKTNAKSVAQNFLSSPVSTLDNHIVQSQVPGVSGLDTLLSLRNVGEPTKWQTMVSPAFNLLYADLKSGQGLLRQNVWFEVLQGNVYGYALGRTTLSSGAFQVGLATIGSAFAGGFPQVRLAGSSGTGTVTVTGTAFDPATQSAIAGKTWTGNLDSANPVAALVPGGPAPAPANSLILAASACVILGVTGGYAYVEASRPSGRSAFPF